jgi:hypothetical protein
MTIGFEKCLGKEMSGWGSDLSASPYNGWKALIAGILLTQHSKKH